jgi:hypothetical protein
MAMGPERKRSRAMSFQSFRDYIARLDELFYEISARQEKARIYV